MIIDHIIGHSFFVSTSLGSAIIIILIIINYLGKFNTDDFQRKLFLTVLCAVLCSTITDFMCDFFEGNFTNFRSSEGINNLLYASNSLYLIAQNCTFYLSVVFIDYFAHKNIQRINKLLVVIVIFLALYSLSVFINLPLGFYFSISQDSHFVPGKLNFIRLILNYGSVLIIIINILLSIKYFKRSQVFSIILFLLITGAGSVMDILFKGSNIFWPCFTAAVLYFYFFIMQSDLKIDSLTGLGNRSSFNEFVDKISWQSSKLEYKIVMIDMDRFKEINDTLGHLEGDNALRDMAAIIKGCIRHSDFAARYGGDEFVLATGADSDVQRLLDRIQDTINQQNEKRIHPYQLYISYGCDVFTTKSGESIDGFIARIDAMMYKQKEERKARGIPTSITAKLPQTENSKASGSN